MVLKINLLPNQYEALSIVLKAMNINFEIERDLYTEKVDENLLLSMLEQEKNGLKTSSQDKTFAWIAEEKKNAGL